MVNGLLMTAVFFLARIATMPPMYHLMYSVVGTQAYARLGPATQGTWVVSCLVLDVMNVMWMVKICRGLPQGALAAQGQGSQRPPAEREAGLRGPGSGPPARLHLPRRCRLQPPSAPARPPRPPHVWPGASGPLVSSTFRGGKPNSAFSPGTCLLTSFRIARMGKTFQA